MIVKTGRLYLWYNDISNKTLVVKVGTGSGSNEYVEIDDTDLANEYTNAVVKMTTEINYDLWATDNVTYDGLWLNNIPSIKEHIYDDERKIIIYVKITTPTAFELGEMGLFVNEEIRDEWVGVTVVEIEPLSPVNGTLWNDSNILKIYNVVESSQGTVTVTSSAPVAPFPIGEQYFDDAVPGGGSGTLYTAITADTWTGATTEVLSTSQPGSPLEGDRWFDTTTPGTGTGTLYEYTGSWGNEGSPTIEPTTPSENDTWFDDNNSILYTYTLNVPAESIMISRNLMSRQFISDVETKVLKYTINI